MDPLLPYKVLRVPLALGVCAGMVGEVLHECESEVAAQALMYDFFMEDKDTVKGVYYTYDVVRWDEM